MEITLQKEEKKSKFSWSKIFLISLLFIIGCFTGYFIGGSVSGNEEINHLPILYKLLFIPVLVFIVFLSIVIHEIGHIIAGLLVKFSFLMLVVGPFMLVKEDEKLKFKWNKNMGFFGGIAGCLPKNNHNIMKRFLFFVSGGPLASLLLSLTCLAVWWFLKIKFEENSLNGFLISFLLKTTAFISAGIFISAAVPFKTSGFYSDGMRIFNLIKGGDIAKLDTALMITISQSVSGVRPADLNVSLLQEVAGLPVDSIFKIYCRIYLYYAFLDLNQSVEAGSNLQLAYDQKEQLPKFYQSVLYLEKAYYEAEYVKNAAQARNEFSMAEHNPYVPEYLFFKAETAILLAENNRDEAMKSAQKSLELIEKSVDKGCAVFEKEWLNSVVGNPK